MTIAIWIIAIIEIVRALQNMFQIMMLKHDTGKRDAAYEAYVESLKIDNRQFVKWMLEKFEKDEQHES